MTERMIVLRWIGNRFREIADAIDDADTVWDELRDGACADTLPASA